MAPFYEPYDPRIREDPYPIYKELRDHAPVYRAEEAKVWVVSRYEDVQRVLTDPEAFSSDAMGYALTGEPVRSSRTGPQPRVVILADPPHHGPMRALLNRAFSPRRIAALEGRLRRMVQGAIAGLRSSSRVDIVSELAVPVPVNVIAGLLGVESARLDDFKRWSDAIVSGATGTARRQCKDPAASFGPSLESLRAYLDDLLERRRAEPVDDLLGVLVGGESGDLALSRDEVVMFAVVLMIAGNETTTNLIANLLRVLLTHREQLARLQDTPSLVPNAIEEALRYESPIQFVYRRVRRDLELRDVSLAEDDIVIALLGAANRDERRFDLPERFDVGRAASGHLAFGFGIHFCLGAALARLEARVVMEECLPDLSKFTISEGRVENVDSFLMRGPRELWLERTG